MADQVLQQVSATLVVILAVTHPLPGVVIDQMRREGIDEEDLFSRFGMRAHHRMFGIWKLGLEREALFLRHGGAEAGLDAMAGNQVGNRRLDVIRQLLVGQHHVGPHRVATDRRAFHAAQHGTKGRGLTPGGVGVPAVLVAVYGTVRALVDLHQARRLGMGGCHRVIFKVAEAARK
ncbi:hypothetical protein D9M73_175750 [compost metagenome]